MIPEQLKEKIRRAYFVDYSCKVRDEKKWLQRTFNAGVAIMATGAIGAAGVAGCLFAAAAGITSAAVILSPLGAGIAVLSMMTTAIGALPIFGAVMYSDKLTRKEIERNIDNGLLVKRYEAEILPGQIKKMEQRRQDLLAETSKILTDIADVKAAFASAAENSPPIAAKPAQDSKPQNPA